MIPRLVLLFLVVIALAACTSPHQATISELQQVDNTLQQVERQQCSVKAAKLKQRLLLNIRGQTYDLSGFLLLAQPHRYYAVAYAEAPAPVFAFRLNNTRKEVLTRPTMLPETVVLEGVMEDVKNIFLYAKHPQWISGKSSVPSVLWRFAISGSIISKTTVTAYRSTSGCSIAADFVIENFVHPYTLKVTLLEISSDVSEDTIQKAFN